MQRHRTHRMSLGRSVWPSGIEVILIASTFLVAASPDPRSEVEAVARSVEAAVRARDVAALENLTADGFTVFHGYGQQESRQVWLQNVRTSGRTIQPASPDELDVNVRVFGDTAVRTWMVRATRPAQKLETWLRIASVFSRQAGKWRLVSMHSSVLHEGPPVPVLNLADVAGLYLLDGGRSIRLTNEGGWLRLVYSSGEVVPVLPIAEGEFDAGGDSRLTFVRDATGRVTEAVRRLGGRDLWHARRK
jgi:ketosteroid isomerase-like protein